MSERDQVQSDRGSEGGGLILFMHGRGRMTIWYRPSHSYNAGTEHVGLSPTRQTSRAPSTKAPRGVP